MQDMEKLRTQGELSRKESSVEAMSVTSWAEARERRVEFAEGLLGFQLDSQVSAQKLEQMQSVLSDINAAGDRFGMEAAYFHAVAEAVGEQLTKDTEVIQKARDERRREHAEMPEEKPNYAELAV